MEYDVVISGAGPAGLSAAIFAAKKEMKAVVLEKHSETGIFPRIQAAYCFANVKFYALCFI